ncbi:EF hand domain-containing protein [Silicimonas algicola]|uniref:EF hand domain-containing protein n=3 Tax=Silicimonas algicola TaxID=1826607 RepID=A0A316G9C4_9RHOB|nr:EF hand domain-containing protein [Silicimonas algicola]
MNMNMTSKLAMICALGLAAPAVAQTSGTTTEGTSTGSGADSSCLISFDVSDDDGNGTVSRDEWAGWREQNFSAMDADGNGEISQEEYAECTSGLTPTMQQASSGSDASGSSSDSGSMDPQSMRTADNMGEADTDQSGTVSADEYRQATQDAQAGGSDGVLVLRRYILLPSTMSDSDLGSMSQTETEARSGQMFRTLDTDQSGDLSQKEWSVEGSMTADMSESYGQQFNQIDADASGSLSRDEFMTSGDAQYDDAVNAMGGMSGTTGSDASASGTTSGSTTAGSSDTASDSSASSTDMDTSASNEPGVFHLFLVPSGSQS